MFVFEQKKKNNTWPSLMYSNLGNSFLQKWASTLGYFGWYSHPIEYLLNTVILEYCPYITYVIWNCHTHTAPFMSTFTCFRVRIISRRTMEQAMHYHMAIVCMWLVPYFAHCGASGHEFYGWSRPFVTFAVRRILGRQASIFGRANWR